MNLAELQTLLIDAPQIKGYVAHTEKVRLWRYEWAVVRGDGNGTVVASGVERKESLAQAAANGALCAIDPDRLV